MTQLIFLPSFLKVKFAMAFNEATKFSVDRSDSLVHMLWKINKVFCINLKKMLTIAVFEVDIFSKSIIK